MISRFPASCWLPLFACLAASPISAQPSRDLLVTGRVLDASDRRALPGVQVTAGTRSVRTDSTGSFRLLTTDTALVVLQLRAPGYRARSDTLNPLTYAGAPLELLLERTAQTLAEVEVRAKSEIVAVELRDFERRSAGSGKFLRRADIEAIGAQTLESLIRSRIPGFSLVRLPNGGVAVAGRRGNELSLVKRPPREEGLADRCYSQVFVNGQRIYAYSAPPSMPPRLDDFDPARIVALEFYRGPAETPTEFSGPSAACGTIAVWTHLAVDSRP